MFKKTIAVLLLLSIVLSSCDGKNKSKSNDFVRIPPIITPAFLSSPIIPPVISAPTHPPPAPANIPDTSPPIAPPAPATPPPPPVVTPKLASISEYVNALFEIQLSSCPVPSEACRKAQEQDPKRLNTGLWKNCLNSELSCPEGKESFLKTHVDCFASELDYAKSYDSCLEAILTCDNPDFNCPESKSACDEVWEKRPKQFACPDVDVDSCANLKSCPKAYYLTSPSDSLKVCSGTGFTSICVDTMSINIGFWAHCREAHKVCLEARLKRLYRLKALKANKGL
ncbi:MAG: hypothetical protein LE178_02260 [Endomicrobium sp.]|nr:hypothetical protein [Endomicrobium sp.]